jgi:hypothetical protein
MEKSGPFPVAPTAPLASIKIKVGNHCACRAYQEHLVISKASKLVNHAHLDSIPRIQIQPLVRIVLQVFLLPVKEVHHVRHALPENLLINKVRTAVNYVLQDNIVAPMMMRDRAKLATKENIRETKVKDCAFLASPVNIMIKQVKHLVLIVP